MQSGDSLDVPSKISNKDDYLIEHNMEWYECWVKCQVDRVPSDLFTALFGYHEYDSYHFKQRFRQVWRTIRDVLITEDSTSIDYIVARLLKEELISPNSEIPEAELSARQLVFAIIGWQTMLFQSDYGSCARQQLQIMDDMNGFQGQSRMVLKQNANACKRSLPDMLLGFGLLLPPPNVPASDTAEAMRAFQSHTCTDPTQINIGTLSSISTVQIKWVDSVSCHLEFDSVRGVLYLFQFPAFCAANTSDSIQNKTSPSNPLHACAKAGHDSKIYGTREDVTLLLIEILLSYRLLFGQTKQGRRAFQKVKSLHGCRAVPKDSLLRELCTRKRCPPVVEDRERESYILHRDFPILRGRLAVLQDYLSQRRPRTWKQLWKDKRDSGQWYTFWAVLIVGSIGTLLAFIQVVLQIIQLANPH